MTTPDTEARTALQELLDERQRYQGWLRALEQRRTATPAHVYERVHTDYTLRLERVMQRLRERAEQLTSTIEGMQARLQTLRSREADRTDERHEYELRAAVGELSPDEWERRREDADRELTAIADDRRQIETELAELQRIVALTREQPEPAPQPQAPEPATAQPQERAAEAPPAPAVPEQQERGPTPAAQPSPWSAPPADRATFRATAPAPTPTASAPADSGAPSTAGEHPLAASPSGESPSIDDFIAEWPLRQMGGEAPSTAPATASWHPPQERAGDVSHTPSASPSTAPGPEPTTEMHQHHVGDGRRDMDKTLKCPECGAMNYATEWYCERCGGELASF